MYLWIVEFNDFASDTIMRVIMRDSMSPSSRSSNMKTIFNRILNRNLVEKTFSREDDYTSFFFIAGFGIDRTRPPFFFMQEESG